MFERFTKDARAVVLGAVEHAERLDADVVGEEHLLLALLDREGSRASFALASLGVTRRRESVERSLAETRRRGGLSAADMDALAGIGIDVAEVVSRVECAHGVGALAGDRRPKGTRGWGRRTGRRPFSRGAKGTLEQSLRIALGRRDRSIGDEHLLLALTARPGVTAEVLADHGATYAAVERVLGGGGEAKAG
ncbi:Clp protease N-terminal domain-containing protein [Streptomyces jeddahensis]|uniref:ATP-dependent Clp protease ATP-binding subunit ClpC1 n=1 Tax=Streptomyces jeddahensis TaxID=1716141 RepID=A0A177HSF4_9ACTN|nr:Clp protease N-terminal domain-containing protein [Streptomyces jeddahensis]OAH13529.1 ATP-dependent Clp protease ATP-binding subunit ClpC1 [Streptomyces jeddahensis]